MIYEHNLPIKEDVLLSVNQLYKKLGSETILDNINLSVKAADTIAIIGNSGSGKSTLLHLLAGLDTPTAGHVAFNQINFCSMSDQILSKTRNLYMGFVYQFHYLLAELNVLENIMIPVDIAYYSSYLAKDIMHYKYQKYKEDKLDECMQILRQLKLEHRVSYYPDQLSGGERQRVAIARAVINRPKIIFADEPTGNLDDKNSAEVFNLLMQLRQYYNSAIILVTHNTNLAESMNKIYTLQHGNIALLK